jgi:hypothetical protein
VSLLTSLSGASCHLGFELIGVANRVVVQLTCDQQDLAQVQASLRAHAPDVRVLEAHDFLSENWEERARFAALLSFGLEDRVFHRLRTPDRSDQDPFVELIARMENVEEDELLLLQVLFAPTRAPWRKDFDEFVSSIEDVDNVRPLVREKFAEPTFAATIRIAALAVTEDAVLSRAGALAAALVDVTRSSSNTLTLLDAASRSIDDEAEDDLARQTCRRGMLLSLSELQALVHCRVPLSGRRSCCAPWCEPNWRLIRSASRVWCLD